MIYSKRLVVYADILGFNELVKDSKNIQAINNALNEIQFTPKISNFINNLEADSEESSGYQFSLFSDNFCLSLPIENIHAFSSILSTLTVQLCSLLERDKPILCRGAIHIGDLYHEGDIVFGQALIDAYQLEQKTAFYPRIILSTDCANELQRCCNWKKDVSQHTFLKDDDGIYYLNFMYGLPMGRPIDPNVIQNGINTLLETNNIHSAMDAMGEPNIQRENTALHQHLSSLKESIERNITQHSNNQNILSKWYWIAKVFNQNLRFWRNDLKSFDITVEEINLHNTLYL